MHSDESLSDGLDDPPPEAATAITITRTVPTSTMPATTTPRRERRATGAACSIRDAGIVGLDSGAAGA
jgi:hypothetical protein